MNFWYWLLSWLPFEWAAPDTMLFMKNALLAVLVVTPLFGLLSTMVVESRMAFFSDALGHSAFTGMAIGALCGLAQPVGAAVLFSVVIALLFTLVRQKTHMASDTAISVFSSAAVALGIFLSTLERPELYQVQQPSHRRHSQCGPRGNRPAGSDSAGPAGAVDHFL
ncbi:MAG: metal ABC transporter permease [Evtepia gabavorous]